MTTDAFTTAARAAAERDWGTTVRAQRPAFIAGARWARDHLAAQEPTDAEVEAAAAVLFRRRVGNDWPEAREEIRGLWRNDARAILTAAKEARHG